MNATPLLLNVDDDAAARYVKGRVLRGAGFEVLDEATGEGAWRLIRERLPALVLLDVRLPDIDGRELCRRIKADPALAGTVVLQVSASHIEMRHRVAALEAGADGYLVEPMEPEELIANVRALLRMRKAEQERQRALEALKDADRRKDEFLAMLAHELRNPLAPIRNAVEILRRTENVASRDRARDMIGRQTEHLARLVDDLLEMSRITQGKLALQMSVVNLQWVVESAAEIARPLIEPRMQKLDIALPADPVWLEVDPVRISQALGNLLNNASKFTPSHGEIRLAALRSPEGVELTVTDSGVGMRPEVLPRVFELFSQADPSIDRARGGLGIGLSLVKGLVEMHGGSVHAQSEGPGFGSRFTVRLPASALRDPAPTEEPGEEGGEGPVAMRRVLVVEDSPDSAEAMRMLLAEYGHQVATVDDGAKAIAMAKAFRPDVMLLDIGLPGIDGYELARRLRAFAETRHVRLIAVTGYGQPSDRARAVEAGFDDYLVKPVDPRQLLLAVREVAKVPG